MLVCTPDEMRLLDKTAVKDYSIPETLLMESAGLAAFRVLMDRYGCPGLRIPILLGGGNNGGDGLVVARHIHANGGTPYLILLADPTKYKKAAKKNLSIAEKLPIPMEAVNSREHLEDILAGADLIVDAIFGTGLDREVSGFYRDAIRCANDSGLPIVSLDIPSGVSGLSGQVMGEAIKAEATVSFGLPKRGNLFYPGFDLGGDLYVTHIGFPRQLVETENCDVSVTLPQPLPPRRADGHKTAFGDVLFIAGAMGYFGAPVLSSMAHLKAGGGFSRLATPYSLAPYLASNASEVVFHGMPETAEGTLSTLGLNDLIRRANDADFVVLGPGLSRNEETQSLIHELIPAIEGPLIIDGDGLAELGERPDLTASRSVPAILTPHLGEMARLTGRSVKQILADPVHAVQSEALSRNAIIVLKGPHTLIGLPDDRVLINLSGNDGMATAGSGDVLTGAITAMHSLGLDVPNAVLAGVYVHGLAGDLAAEDMGKDGMTAWDVLEYLPEAVDSYRNQWDKLMENHCQKITVI